MAAMPRPSTPLVNEPVLEGLAMAGLVAVLRHLGDLAELAAEVFDGLQDQAVAVAARGRRLTARAKQLQADLDHQLPPSVIRRKNGHRHLLCQAQTRTLTQRQQQQPQQQQCLVVSVTGGEAPPRSIVNHIKSCRGPPRLSALDRFDAHGDGACLKRYSDPSFFRAENACSANHLRQADSDHHITRSQTDGYGKKSLGLLSMLRRQLKHRHTAGAISCPSLKHQTACKSSAERRDSSDTDLSFTASSPGFDDAAGADYVGSCCELERTSSFEAWLSPGARFSAHDEYETAGVMEAKQDSAAAEASCNKGVSRSHRYKGSTSLPRKLCLKQQHGPLAEADSSRSHHTSGTGGLRSKSSAGTEDFLPVLVADPVFSMQDSVLPESEESYSDAKDVLSPRMQRTGCETDKSLHTELTSAYSSENINSCWEGTKVDTTPLLPIPPMQWLSVKVHTGPITSYRKPFGKDHVQRAGGKILKTRELSGLYEGWSGAEIHSQQEPRQQLATDRDMEVTDRPTENVFFSAVEQLARMSPPSWLPKDTLPEVASSDRITLRNGPSPIHGSRSILDCRTATLVEQTKDKVSGTSSPVSATTVSPTNILQRADDTRTSGSRGQQRR